MLSELEDKYLVEMIKDGSHPAFTALVRRHARYFHSISYRYLGSKNEAEDVVQGAFLKLWEFPDRFDGTLKTSFKAWFCRVVINLSIDTLRKKKMTVNVDSLSIADERASTEQSIDRERGMHKIEEAIRRLPARQQTALNLGFYEQMPYGDVAIIMKTNLKSVQSLIMRAKNNLKKLVGEDI